MAMDRFAFDATVVVYGPDEDGRHWLRVDAEGESLVLPVADHEPHNAALRTWRSRHAIGAATARDL